MKKFRLLPLLALVIAIAASAFTTARKAAVTSEAWFIYDGMGSKTDQNSYSYSSVDPGCNASEELCAVHAEIDPATFNPSNPASSRPLENGTGVRSLQTLSSQSNTFTQPTEDVELQD